VAILKTYITNLYNFSRQLSMEKSYLENSYDEEGKAKARMSMQVQLNFYFYFSKLSNPLLLYAII
jgi:hypothetical protein